MRRGILFASLAVGAVAVLPATKSFAQVFTPTQTELLGLIDENAPGNSGFGGSGRVTSITADAAGGVVVDGTFGSAGDPKLAFDLTSGFNTPVNGGTAINFTSFGATTDSDVVVTLLSGATAAEPISVVQFAQNNSAESFNFVQDGGVSLASAGSSATDDFNFASAGLAVPTDLIRYGFQVFPNGEPQPVRPANSAFSIEIDPVAVPEPATLSLLGIGLPALLMRRRANKA
jgi:hypothetical protein